MGLFSKKKMDVSQPPAMPRFEEAHEGFLEDKMPNYESAFTKDLGGEHDVGPVMGVSPFKKQDMNDDLHLPAREPNFLKPKTDYTERINPNELNETFPQVENRPEITSPFKKEMPMPKVENLEPRFESFPSEDETEEAYQAPKMVLRKQINIPKKILDERPVFVQIDDYKDAMNNIEILKQKIREVEYILDKLNEIKSQEQLEMSNCETALNKIKERLIEIDKKLFEI